MRRTARPGVIARDFSRHKYTYFMLIPVLAYYLIFSYLPMYGAFMGFEDYNLVKGVLGSPLTAHGGFGNFLQFFQSPYFGRVVGNTLYLNFLLLVFGFPVPIAFALLLNEVRNRGFKRVVQTISYMPYFISLVVVVGIIYDFTSVGGLLNNMAHSLGFKENINLLAKTSFYRPIYVGSDIWQAMGFNSIIYISAITGINPELYQAAEIDGAGRWAQVFHVTLPSISSTIVILLILSLGNVMSVGVQKVLLLYSPVVYSVADVVSSYVFRQGVVMAQFGYSAAVGLFNSAANLIVLVLANWLSSRYTGTRLF